MRELVPGTGTGRASGVWRVGETLKIIACRICGRIEVMWNIWPDNVRLDDAWRSSLPFAPINLKLALGNAISDKKIACHLLMTVFV